ncbi:MAG: hypothetical protein ACTS3F_03515 [Phycisphaerales bacterium]
MLDPRIGRFVAGRACDRSEGGIRLRVRSVRAFEPGQGVRLLVADASASPGPGGSAGILPADAARTCIVRRSRAVGAGEQEIALQFAARASDPGEASSPGPARPPSASAAA